MFVMSFDELFEVMNEHFEPRVTCTAKEIIDFVRDYLTKKEEQIRAGIPDSETDEEIDSD